MKIYEIATGYTPIPAQIGAATEIVVEALTRAFRNRGIARKLVDTILADARSIGYHEMLLDTLPFLMEAIAMYEGLGFVRTECYNDSPLDTTIYMKLKL